MGRGVQDHRCDSRYDEVVAETLWLLDLQAKRVGALWDDPAATADFLHAVHWHSVALTVNALGPRRAKSVLG